jgi:hypothetical protein
MLRKNFAQEFPETAVINYAAEVLKFKQSEIFFSVVDFCFKGIVSRDFGTLF